MAGSKYLVIMSVGGCKAEQHQQVPNRIRHLCLQTAGSLAGIQDLCRYLPLTSHHLLGWGLPQQVIKILCSSPQQPTTEGRSRWVEDFCPYPLGCVSSSPSAVFFPKGFLLCSELKESSHCKGTTLDWQERGACHGLEGSHVSQCGPGDILFCSGGQKQYSFNRNTILEWSCLRPTPNSFLQMFSQIQNNQSSLVAFNSISFLSRDVRAIWFVRMFMDPESGKCVPPWRVTVGEIIW